MPNQNNNEEWWKKRFTIEPTSIEELDLDLDEEMMALENDEFILTVLREEINALFAAQIQAAKAQARTEGKREGLEEARAIVKDTTTYSIITLQKIDQAIKKLNQ